MGARPRPRRLGGGGLFFPGGARPRRRLQLLVHPRDEAGLVALARFIPGVTVDSGYALADRIHNSGQAIVWTGQREPAELYWEQLKDAGLTMAPL